MIEHLKAPNGERYPVKNTRMIGDELWVQLDTTARADMPMSRWFKAFDLAGLWLSNHPAIDRLRGVKPPFETGLLYGCQEPPRAIVVYVPSPYDFKTLWLQLANGILQRAKETLDMRVTIADTEIARAA